MSYIEPKCLLKAKNWIQNVRNPSGEIWGLSFAATHSVNERHRFTIQFKIIRNIMHYHDIQNLNQ